MSNSNLIVMLTHNDVTVENAQALFAELKELPVNFWGFKDIGLDTGLMKELVAQMKAAGKTTFLEVVHYGEKECLEATELALECNVDYLTGTIFYDSILDRVRTEDIKYFPFFGHIHGHPVLLSGSVDEIVDHGKQLEEKGVDGLDLVAYRYEQSEKAGELVERCRMELGIPLISAGSINSWERLDETDRCKIWAFTIGGAFFEKQFVPDGSFGEQIMAVQGRLKG